MKKVKSKSIREQIMAGYSKIITLIVLFAIVTIICLLSVWGNYSVVVANQANRSSIQTAIAGHYQWLDQLSTSIQTGQAFGGSLDHTSCSFGKWLSGITDDDLSNQAIRSALDKIVMPHEEIHTMAKDIIDLSATDKEEAYQQYATEIKPRTTEVLNQLQVLDSCYEQAASAASGRLSLLILFAGVFAVLLTTAITIYSILFAKKVSFRISRPISVMVDWAKKLALGMDNLDYDKSLMDGNEGSEVGEMVKAFQIMVESIQENVGIVSRVAEGDMTAFVNIRSSKDSLGKNIYRMVQANDFLFNEVMQVAHTVATGSGEIARASQELAKSASVQAEAVSSLSGTIQHASSLISQNDEKTQAVQVVTNTIKSGSHESNEKMKLLMQSMENIRAASERISSVIKSIDDIAFETNILALNAAIEAARAGEAGKGFAVVADEVRALALKSSEAADESKTLIEDAIHKTHEGSQTASEASALFTTIMKEIDQIAVMIQEVAVSSKEQLQGIEVINKEILQISDAASGNAAISEESAASSEEMSSNAELLRKSMSKFKLRNRSQSGAYIPPEKANDPEFIRIANEAYRKAQETGSYGYEYIDPRGKQLETQI